VTVPQLARADDSSITEVQTLDVKAMLSHHVDDLTCASPCPLSTLKQIAQTGPVSMDDATLLSSESVKLVGFDVFRTDKAICQSMEGYLTLKALPLGKRSGVLVESDFLPPSPGEIDMSLEDEMRKWVGRAMWVSRSRFDIAFAVFTLAQFSNTPTVRHLAAVITVLHLVAAKRKRLRFVRIRFRFAQLRLFVDAAFDASTCSSRSAFLFQLADASWSLICWLNILDWATHKEKRKVLSAPGAELLAIRMGLKRLPLMLRTLHFLFPSLEVVLFSDSATSLSQMETGVAKKEEGLSGILAWCVQEVKRMDVKLRHCDGKTQQLADGLTKFKKFDDTWSADFE